jgi:hypothetical protein
MKNSVPHFKKVIRHTGWLFRLICLPAVLSCLALRLNAQCTTGVSGCSCTANEFVGSDGTFEPGTSNVPAGCVASFCNPSSGEVNNINTTYYAKQNTSNTDPGRYRVVRSNNQMNGGCPYSNTWTTHGGDYALAVDVHQTNISGVPHTTDASGSTAYRHVIWSKSVTVPNGASYMFQVYVRSAFHATNPGSCSRYNADGTSDLDDSRVSISITNTSTGTTTTGPTMLVDETINGWSTLSCFTTLAGSGSTTLNLALNAEDFVMYAGGGFFGNDIFIDDITFTEVSGVSCESAPCNTPTPVTWLSFKGSIVQEGTLLTWQTTSEVNNSKFIVQSSTDGISYKSIGSIPAGIPGNFSNSYTFLDQSIYAESVIYYRILQLDIDDSQNFSRVIAVSSDNIGLAILVSPNPFQDETKAIFRSLSETSCLVDILDVSGKIAYSAVHPTNTEISLGEGLPSGVYIVSMKGSSEVKNVRIVKM